MTKHIEEARKLADDWALAGCEDPCAMDIAASLAAAEERGRMAERWRKTDVDFLARAILRILEDHDSCPPQARDGSRRNGTANLIMAACKVATITKEPTHTNPQRNNYVERYDGID